MNVIESVIMSFFDVSFTIILSKKLLQNKKKINIVDILAMILVAVAGGLAGFYIPQGYKIIVTSILSYTIVLAVFHEDYDRTFFAYVMSTVLLATTQLISMLPVQLFFGQVTYSFEYGIVSQLFTLILIFIIQYFLPIRVIFDFVLKRNKVFMILLFNIFIVLLTILLYWQINMKGLLENLIYFTALSSGIFFINFVMLKNGLINKYENQQLQIYEQYMPVIDDLINDIRARQHEFDNHIQTISMITYATTDYDETKRLMKEYINDITAENDLGDLIKLDNKVLAGFLYSKMKQAKEMGISFIIDIKDYGIRTLLKDFELIEIVGILVNNAFETGIDNNEVSLVIKKEKNTNVIEVSNKHPYLSKESINNLFKKGYSTKSSETRGYGLYNLKQIINKNNGEIVVLNKDFDDNYVVFRVVIN